MLKKFFISMLGTMAGMFLTLLIAGFTIFILIASLAGGSASDSIIRDKSVLYLKLDGTLPERYSSQSLVDILNEAEKDGESVSDIIDALDLAADDDRIEGVYIDALGASSGVASREEIAAAIRRFKESGKWVLAYADSYGQGDYMLASLADTVYLNPCGSIDVRGIATQSPFLTGLLDKLGIKMQILKVGTYKSAVEPFVNTEMSPAARLQSQAMVDTMWSVIAGTIAEARKVKVSQVNSWADTIMFCLPAAIDVSLGAASVTAYRRQVENVIRDRCGLKQDEDLRLVLPSDYMLQAPKFGSEKEHVAVLFASGDIVDRGNEGISGEAMAPQIIELADNDKVAGLVLRVNSGGGSAFASEQIWEALEYFKSKGKPYYVSMGDYAASGGYYISCGADSIWADRSTITGSIGVFGMVPDFSGLITGKLGVTFDGVSSNPNATFLSVLGPMTQQQHDAMQRSVEDIYELFTSRVAAGRGMSQDSVKSIAEGRVWTGGAALELGLVDCIGTMYDAIGAITGRLDLDRGDVVYYPEISDSFMSTLIRNAVEDNAAVRDINDATRAARLVRYFREMAPVQARMPLVITEN